MFSLSYILQRGSYRLLPRALVTSGDMPAPRPGKPPNILVQEAAGDTAALVTLLERAVRADRYVVYSVPARVLAESRAWLQTTELLVLRDPDPATSPGLDTRLREFVSSGGKLLDLRQPPSDLFRDLPEQSYHHAELTPSVPELRALLRDKLGVDVGDDEDQADVGASPYSVGYFIGDEESLQDLLQRRKKTEGAEEHKLLKQTKMTLDFRSEDVQGKPAPDYLPVRPGAESAMFRAAPYLTHLRTRHLGRPLLHVPVLGSTMAPFEGPPLGHGWTVVAGRQVAGVGRGGNKWLSPLGCSMFSMQVCVCDKYFPETSHIFGSD